MTPLILAIASAALLYGGLKLHKNYRMIDRLFDDVFRPHCDFCDHTFANPEGKQAEKIILRIGDVGICEDCIEACAETIKEAKQKGKVVTNAPAL